MRRCRRHRLGAAGARQSAICTHTWEDLALPKEEHEEARRSTRRMSRFRGLAPSRDANGRSLPSDRHVQRVTLRLPCQGPAHADRGAPRVLGGFWIYSWFDEFNSQQVNEEKPNRGVVDRSFVSDGDGDAPNAHQRYLFRCQHDGCTRTPTLRADTIDAWLAAEYERGVYDKVVYRFI